MAYGVRRQNPSYNSYVGKKNRESIYLPDMNDNLRDRLIRTVKMCIQKIEFNGLPKKTHDTFARILTRLNNGETRFTARQFDQLYFECSKPLQEEIDNLRKNSKAAVIFDKLGT